MGTCKECEHWTGEPAESGYRRCLHPKVGRIPSPMVPDGAATLAVPDYIVPSCVVVGPDFGCIHHMPRDCRELDAMRERDEGRVIGNNP